MKEYTNVGNCTNIFDDDGDCTLRIFTDTSDFARQEEQAVLITK